MPLGSAVVSRSAWVTSFCRAPAAADTALKPTGVVPPTAYAFELLTKLLPACTKPVTLTVPETTTGLFAVP